MRDQEVGGPKRGRRRTAWVLGVAALLAVGAFAAIYLIFFTPESPERLRLSQGRQGPAADPSSLTGLWTATRESEAGYRVREQLARLPAKNDAVGRTNAVTGGLEVSRDGDRLQVRAVRLSVDVTTLKSDEDRRDRRIRTLGLESDRFPMATFVSAGPFEVPSAVLGGSRVESSVTGDLTIHGVTRRVTIPLQVQLQGGRAEAVGSHRFPFSEFGMEPPSIASFVTVDPEATLEFRIVLVKA